MINYLYSLLPIADALIWGSADALHNENPKDLIKNFFFTPLRPIKNFDFIARAGWRAGVFSVCSVSFEDLNMFTIFFCLILFTEEGKDIFLRKKS